MASEKIGLIYHRDMLLHSQSLSDPKVSLKHPENPKRLENIINQLENSNLTKSPKVETITSYPEADENFVIGAHITPDYYQYIKDIFPKDRDSEQAYYADTYINPHTARAALQSAGGIKLSVDKICNNEWSNSLAAIRPPGHHAGTCGTISGFCFINNIVCGAKYAKSKYNLKKILIFDWDVHHGDSSQKLTYEDDSILYISFHRFDKGSFFPGKSGNAKNLGADCALGKNQNLGWDIEWKRDYKIVDDQEYIYAFERLVVPIVKEFKPELIFISAGFDSLKGDPLGGIAATENTYRHITQRFLQLSKDRRVIIALEGGYNLEKMPVAVEAVFRVQCQSNKEKDEWKDEIFDYGKKCLPSFWNFSVIETTRNVWGKCWDCQKTDKATAEQYEIVKQNLFTKNNQVGVECEVITEGRIQIDLSEGVGTLKKKVPNCEIEFWKLLESAENNVLTEFFPKILEINEVAHEIVMEYLDLFNETDKSGRSIMKIDIKFFSDERSFLMRETKVCKSRPEGPDMKYRTNDEFISKGNWKGVDNNFDDAFGIFQTCDYVNLGHEQKYLEGISCLIEKFCGKFEEANLKNRVKEIGVVLWVDHDKKEYGLKFFGGKVIDENDEQKDFDVISVMRNEILPKLQELKDRVSKDGVKSLRNDIFMGY